MSLVADSLCPADAQADLGLRRPHISEDTFSLGAAHLKFPVISYTASNRNQKLSKRHDESI